MKTLTIREFRASIGNLKELTEQMGEIKITKNGKPILRILPIQTKLQRPAHKKLRLKMAALKISSAQYLREDRNER